MATVPRSPVARRYYPAWSPRQDIPPNLVLTFYQGLDTFFGGPGQPPANLDWPPPRRAQHPISARTWIFGADQIPADITVAPTNIDPRSPTYTRYYPANAPRNYDPPNIALTTLQTAAPTAPPISQNDWPAPKLGAPFMSTHSLSLLALAIGNPVIPPDFPLPRVRPHPVSARTWINSGLALVGQDVQFTAPGEGKSYDYPLPRQPQYPPANRRFTHGLTAAEITGNDQFFGLGGPSFDYPLPKRPQYPIGNRTWIYTPSLLLSPNLAGTTTFFTAGGPVYDYPLPRQPQYPISNRTWINSLNLNLVGLDQFFGIPGQPPANMNWPNPKVARPLAAWQPVTNMELLVTPAPPPPPPPPPPPIWTVDHAAGGTWTKKGKNSGTWSKVNPQGGGWTKK